MKERTQIALLSAALGMSIAIGFSLWLEASTDTQRFLIPPMLGSVTALLIAFIAYAWQKRLDREADFGIEQRAALRDFLEAWYCLAMETNDLVKLKPNKEDPTELVRHLLEIRNKRQKLTFAYILICPEGDVGQVIDLDHQHENIMKDISEFIQSWLDSPDNAVMPFEDYKRFVRSALENWRNPHVKTLEHLVNSCRQRTPFITFETPIGFGDKNSTN